MPKTTEEIVKEYALTIAGRYRSFIKLKWYSEEELIKVIDELAKEDIYHQIGKPEVWRMKNDEVLDKTQEFIVKWLKQKLGLKR